MIVSQGQAEKDKFLGRRQRTLLFTSQPVPWASRFHQFPLLPISHRGDAKGPKWMFHTQWACVTARNPSLGNPDLRSVCQQISPAFIPEDMLIRKQICPLSGKETLPLSSQIVCCTGILAGIENHLSPWKIIFQQTVYRNCKVLWPCLRWVPSQFSSMPFQT